jgi:hypothetical protein
MKVKQLDTLLAIKVLSYAPGLTANARAVGALLVDRYNRKTGQCDPGLNSIATHLSVSSRTVMRSVRQLESADLLRKLRHGGHGNRNQYEPNWARFREIETEWCARLRQRRSGANPELSPSRRQTRHVEGDKPVTQTYSTNLQTDERYLGSRPNEERGRTQPSPRKMITPRSRDAAETEAERRWTKTLHDRFASKPLTYGDIVAAITPEIRIAATSAELKNLGAGFAYILRRLKLGPDPSQSDGQ